jgi:hypothetical protein
MAVKIPAAIRSKKIYAAINDIDLPAIWDRA